MGDTGAKTSRHKAVVDRLRTRFGQYRQHHRDVQSKYESSLPALEKQERQQAMVLQQRVIVDRERKLLKGKQQDGETKPELPPNGVDTKSTNAILQHHLKRKSLNNPHALLCTNEKESGSNECRNKRQREDIAAAFPLHSGEQQINSSSSQHEKSSGIPGQPVDSSMSFAGGSTPSSYVHVNPGSVGATTPPGLGGFPADGSSLQPSDFKQESQVTSVSCDEQTSAGQSGACSSEAGQSGQSPSKYAGTYLAQELSDFERVFQGYKKAAEEKITSDALTLNITNQGQENGATQRKLATAHEADQNQRMQVQLTNRQVRPPRLQDFTHEPSLTLTSPVTQGRTVMFGDGQTHGQYSSEHQQVMDDRQDIPQRPPFQTDLFSAFGNAPQLLSENIQGYPVRNQPMAHQSDAHLFQRTPQTHNSQQNVYNFSPQQSLSSKLSHPPLEGQHRTPFPPFHNTQGLSSSMGRASTAPIGPMTSQDLPRLSGAMYTSPPVQQQPLFQRQQSVPTGPRQPFLGVEPLQQDMQPFPTSDHQLLPNAQGLQASYHYQRRNSYPLYQRNSMQPMRGFAQNSQQMNSPTSGLQNSVSKFGPPISVSSGPRMQPVNPYQGLRASADLSHSTHAFPTAMYNNHNRQDIVTSLPQVTHAGRKATHGSVYQYRVNPGIPVRSTADVGQPSFSGSLVKAPSFTSILEQSAVNQGNLGTTYTGSIPNLELLTEILGPN